MLSNTITTISKWWSSPIETIYKALASQPSGLSHDEAKKRRELYGKNEITSKKRFTLLERFISKLANPLILTLLGAAGVSALLGQFTDFFIIAAITLVSITVDIYEEHQATEGAEKLKRRVSLTATVFRDGIRTEIPMTKIVPGDVVSLTTGDIVPGDGRILSCRHFLVNQSELTGESYPQEKNADAIPSDTAPISERKNCVFMGTNVTSGEATVLIAATGKNTQIGELAQELIRTRPPTEFERGITDYGFLLMKTTIICAVAVLFLHVITGHNLLSSLLFVLALMIGFEPELLPIIITINLSKGAIRMSGKGVIVKSLPSIEDFGSMDILCTDKTGTLTENKIVLEKYEDIDGNTEEKVLLYGYVNSAFQSGLRGPMEDAVLAHHEIATSGFQHADTIPFDFYRKRVTVVVEKNNKHYLITKGAPEEIFPIVTSVERKGVHTPFHEKNKTQAMKQFNALSRDGFRVLAVSYKELHSTKIKYDTADEKEETLLGFMAFFDPPKKSTAHSLEVLSRQGIAIRILTGDNELVTEKICKEIG